MRIALLNEISQPGQGGGCEAHLAALYRGLVERGHEVDIVGESWVSAAERADIVHVHNMTTVYGPSVFRHCRELGRPTVVSLHDYWPFCPSRMAVHDGQNCHGAGCRHQCRKEIPAWFDDIRRLPCVSFTARCVEIFRQHGIESTVIPHGLNLTFWHYRPVEEHEGPVRVACCTAWGNSPWKGMHVARDVERILGREATFRYILGGQGREAVRDLYWWADVVLVPSLYEETFCLVAAEAQACGRPVVAFAVGGLRELASATADEGDVTGLARAILGWRGLALRPIRSYQVMAADYETLYLRTMAERREAAGLAAVS